jgi:exopolysaccharide biosynthesis polyprenyl glycosylphosphotransferase
MNTSRFNFTVSERQVLLFLIDHLVSLGGIYVYILIVHPSFNKVDLYLSFGYFLIINSMVNGVFRTYTSSIATKVIKLHIILFVYALTFSIYLLTPIITPVLPQSRKFIFYLIMFLPFVMVFVRYLFIRIIYRTELSTNVLILGNDREIKYLDENFDYEYHFQNVSKRIVLGIDQKIDNSLIIEVDGYLKENNVNVIVLAFNKIEGSLHHLNRIIENCSLNSIEIYDFLKYYESYHLKIPLDKLDDNLYTYFPFTRNNLNLIYKGLHRLMDIAFALIGLLFFLLVTPIIIVLNIFFNRGPLFFKQKRVGRGGKEFTIIKLRSMVVDAEKGGAQMAKKNDARVTAFGKILRKYRFDELPQFWNVLIGEMSLIGPRPERKVYVDQLSDAIEFYNLRHMVKPGITGWAQVKYKYGENLEDSFEKLKYDLFYIKNRSLLMDFKILVNTVNTIIFSKGQ